MRRTRIKFEWQGAPEASAPLCARGRVDARRRPARNPSVWTQVRARNEEVRVCGRARSRDRTTDPPLTPSPAAEEAEGGEEAIRLICGGDAVDPVGLAARRDVEDQMAGLRLDDGGNVGQVAAAILRLGTLQRHVLREERAFAAVERPVREARHRVVRAVLLVEHAGGPHARPQRLHEPGVHRMVAVMVELRHVDGTDRFGQQILRLPLRPVRTAKAVREVSCAEEAELAVPRDKAAAEAVLVERLRARLHAVRCRPSGRSGHLHRG